MQVKPNVGPGPSFYIPQESLMHIVRQRTREKKKKKKGKDGQREESLGSSGRPAGKAMKQKVNYNRG